MKEDFPKIELRNLCKIARGGSPRPIKNFITHEPDGINWIKIGDAEQGGRYIDSTAQRIKPDGISRSRFVEAGSFLLSNSMSFGRPYILRISGCIHDGWLVLEPDYERVSQDFLYHALSSQAVFDQFNSLAAGSTVRNLNIDLVKGVQIPLPPLEDQQRIVAVLDEAFEGLTRAREYVEANLLSLNHLRQSLLQRAFAGELTSVKAGWQELAIEDCLDRFTVPAKIKSKEFLGAGTYPVVSQEAEFINGYWNQVHDLCQLKRPVVVYGDHTQVVKFIDFDFVVGADGVKILAPKPFLNPRYLYYFLMGNRVPSLGYARHYRHLKKLPLRYPPLEDQQRIVAVLDEAFEGLTRAREYAEANLLSLNHLRQALLQRAFAGELT